MRRLILVIPLVHALACGEDAAPPAERRVRTERDERGLVTCSGQTDELTCRAHRVIAGVSMGAGGAAQIGLMRPDLFDTVVMLGSPGMDFGYMLSAMQRLYLGGFCDRETILANLDRVNDPAGPAFCGPAAGREVLDREGRMVEPPQDFNRWWTGHQGGPGERFTRDAFREVVQDLSRAYGNPFSYNPDSPYWPPGVPESDAARSFEERCQAPVRLLGVRHPLYNPDGAFPVIAACDTSTETGNFDPANPAQIPLEVMLTVDYDGNGRRDFAEPVLTWFGEPYRDEGRGAGDVFDWRTNPGGRGGNGRYDDGEPFDDFGLDGVPGTGDLGEGNGRYDANPNLARWYESGAVHLLGQVPDAQLARLNLYADAGIRDFLLSGFATSWLWAHLARRAEGTRVADYLGFGRLPGADPGGFDFLDVDFTESAVGRHVYVRYGDPDADERAIRAGDGHHVGSVQQVLERMLVAFQFVDARRFEPDRTVVRDFDIGALIGHDSYESQALGETRRFGIALPPGYDREEHASLRYPVVYFLHGIGQDFGSLTQLALLFHNYMGESARPERSRRGQSDWGKFILVVPDSLCRRDECERGSFNANHVYTRGEKANFQDAFFELMRFVESKYRVRPPEEIPLAEL